MRETTDFGFKTLPSSEKTTKVQDLFSAVAPHYDVMNDLMSLGLHRLWKTHLVDRVAMKPDGIFLDVASGTGDVARALLARAQKELVDARVIGTDLNPDMLRRAQDRTLDLGILDNIEWQVASAEELPFETGTFDAVTISFGLRNVTHKEKALQEMCRVLKPGGQFLCLEFVPLTSSERPILGALYDAYSFHILPKLGGWIAKNPDAYQYLAESIRTFPKPEVLLNMMGDAGFAHCSVTFEAGGIVALHQGWRPLKNPL